MVVGQVPVPGQSDCISRQYEGNGAGPIGDDADLPRAFGGADLQEREIWDLMGIWFDGHPNLKRILLWENFPGHPLRKDCID